MAKTKVEYWFDPLSGVEIKSSKKKEALKDIADVILESILKDASNGISSVTGVKWKGLSAEYKKIKKKETGSTAANLELHGDLLDSLIVKPSQGGILITVPSSQMGKADGHNNFSGDSKLPPRKFIPNKEHGESLRTGILKEIDQIIQDYSDDGG